MSRHRVKPRPHPVPGAIKYYLFGSPAGVEYAPDAEYRSDVCDDSTSPYPYHQENNLYISHDTAGVMRISGTVYDPPYWRYDYEGYNPLNRSSYVYCPGAGLPVDWNYWRTLALGNMNPSTPIIDLQNFIFEFKDFPDMLKNMGDILSRKRSPRDVANGYLAYSFGWAPFLADLTTLCKLAKKLDERLKYLRALERGTTVRRHLGDFSYTNHYPDSYGHPLAVVYADETVSYSLEAWYTARLKLESPLPPASELPAEVVKLAFGVKNVSASTIWNAVPWTWLSDYFFNIGDMLDAQRGYYRYSQNTMCVMVKQRGTSTLTNVRTPPGISVSGLTSISELKQRGVYVNPLPFFAYKPFLTRDHIANLGALVTARSLGGSSRLAR